MKNNTEQENISTDLQNEEADSDSIQTIDKIEASVTVKSKLVNGNQQVETILIDSNHKSTTSSNNAASQRKLKAKKLSQGNKQINVDFPEIYHDQLRALALIIRTLWAKGVTVNFYPLIRLFNEVLKKVSPRDALNEVQINKLLLGEAYIDKPIADVLHDIQVYMWRIGIAVINTPKIWEMKNPTQYYIYNQMSQHQKSYGWMGQLLSKLKSLIIGLENNWNNR